MNRKNRLMEELDAMPGDFADDPRRRDKIKCTRPGCTSFITFTAEDLGPKELCDLKPSVADSLIRRAGWRWGPNGWECPHHQQGGDNE